MRSSTSCVAESVNAQVTGSPLGQAANVEAGTGIGYASSTSAAVSLSSPFRMSGCNTLKCTPKLSLTLSGRGQTSVGRHSQLTATVTQPAGQVNLRSGQVVRAAISGARSEQLGERLLGRRPRRSRAPHRR